MIGKFRRTALLAAAALLLAGPAAFAQSLVLNGVTVVDTHTGKLTRNQSVAIDGGKIVQIARAGSVKAGAGAMVIDARDKYLVPGFLDMHVHSFNAPDPSDSLHLMLANGITGVRQMSGSPELLAQRRDGKLVLPADGPALLAMPGTILTGANAGTVEAAVAEVDRQKEMGADFIKVIDVKPDPFFAALAEAKRLGLAFDGHLQPTAEVEKAADAGMTGIEHLGPKESVLLGCSTDEAALRKLIAATPPKAPPSAGGPAPAEVALRATTNPIMATDPIEFDIMKRVVATYSDDKCRALAKRPQIRPSPAARSISAMPPRPAGPTSSGEDAAALGTDGAAIPADRHARAGARPGAATAADEGRALHGLAASRRKRPISC